MKKALFSSFCRQASILFLCVVASSGLCLSTALATLKNPHYEVADNIVVIVEGGSHDRSPESVEGSKLRRENPALSEDAIRQRVVAYLGQNLSADVKQHAKIHLPTGYWDWPVSPATLVLKINYMVRTLTFDGQEYPVVALTVGLFRPQFTDPNRVGSAAPFNTSISWSPVVSFHASSDPSRLSTDLDDALDALLKSVVTALYLAPSTKEAEKPTR